MDFYLFMFAQNEINTIEMKTNKSIFSIVFFAVTFLWVNNTFSQTLNPPRNLTATVEDENDVVLFWEQPNLNDSIYLHWDSGENADSYGFLISAAEWSAANRWDTANLASYDGWEVRKIRFYVVNQPYKLKIKIWVGANPVEVYSQQVDDEEYQANTWSEIELDEPFIIDASQELRIGLYANMVYPGAVVGLDDGPEVDGYGNWYLYNNTWYKQGAGNWNIQALAIKPSEPVTLHWDNGHKDINAFGFEIGAAAYACAAQWDPAHLSGYDGWEIKSMKFYLQNTAPTTVKLKIWEGPGFNEVYSQTVDTYNLNGWSEITLDTPFTIDASKKIRAGIFVDVPVPAHVIGADDGPLIQGYGFWLQYNGSWYTASQAGMPYNMNMQLNLENGKESKDREKGLLGYNVYRDSVKLNPEPVSPTVYLDEDLFNGFYDYYVTAVYEEGESEPSNTITVQINQPGIYKPDSLALVDLYNQCNGENWFLQDGWFQLPISEWHGITVDSNRVTKIRLQLNNLTGDLPESLGNLTALKTLYLSGNEITSIPETIGNLDSLDYFWISYNPLFTLPDAICDLENITDLNFTECNLTALPDNFGNLTKLEYLGLSGNQINSLPESFGSLSSLAFLFLSYNELVSLPSGFGNLSKLYYLSLTNNNLQALPDNFSNLNDLTVLLMEQNAVSELPVNFGNLDNLVYFEISNNNLESLPDNFGNLSKLSIFYAGVNQIQSLPASFGNLSTLDTAVLAMNQIPAIPDNIGDLDDLKYLNLSYNSISSLPESLGDMELLQELYLQVNNIGSLPSSFSDLDNVKVVNLAVNSLTAFPENVENMLSLESLNLNQNQISEVPATIGQLYNLKGLGLSVNNLTELPEEIGELDLSALTLNNNHIKELPSTMYDNLYQYLYVYSNNLQFGSLEPFVGNVQHYQYVPQGKIGNDTTIVLEEGTDLNHTIQVSGEYNVYQWYKNNFPLAGQNTNTLHFENVSMSVQGTYTLKVTNTFVDSLELVSYPVNVSIVTATPETEEVNFNIYPNPVKGEVVNVVLPDNENVKSVEIYNLQGKRVKVFMNLSKINSFDVSHLTGGMYLVKVNTVDGRSSVKKIVLD